MFSQYNSVQILYQPSSHVRHHREVNAMLIELFSICFRLKHKQFNYSRIRFTTAVSYINYYKLCNDVELRNSMYYYEFLKICQFSILISIFNYKIVCSISQYFHRLYLLNLLIYRN